MCKLKLLVGPVASGKSTYCKEAARQGAIIVNDDALVMAIHAGDYQLYSKELKPLYKALENHLVEFGLILGRTVVVDRPNHSRQMRKRYIALAQSLDATVEAVCFPREDPAIHAERRMKSDPRGYTFDYWLDVAKSHELLYEPPDLNEGFGIISHWKFPA